MNKSKVAILKTTPKTVLKDYHELMNLTGYTEVLPKDADTALKVNISWHFFYPGSSTTPWQLDGVIRAMKKDGYNSDLIHACHNRTVVIDARLAFKRFGSDQDRIMMMMLLFMLLLLCTYDMYDNANNEAIQFLLMLPQNLMLLF